MPWLSLSQSACSRQSCRLFFHTTSIQKEKISPSAKVIRPSCFPASIPIYSIQCPLLSRTKLSINMSQAHKGTVQVEQYWSRTVGSSPLCPPLVPSATSASRSL